jgi:hypothetical protein
MKKIFLLALWAGVCANPQLFAQRFEGKLMLKGPDNESASYFIKGDKSRIETTDEGVPVVLLYTRKEPKMYALMPKEKKYTEVPVMNLSGEPDENDDSGKITKTGETRQIHGYTCEKWVYTNGNERTETWVTNQLGLTFVDLFNPMVGMSLAQGQHKLSDYFPMLITYSKKTKTETIMEVTAVEKRPLNDNLFAVPAGYQKMY